jgi:hypothetical protein
MSAVRKQRYFAHDWRLGLRITATVITTAALVCGIINGATCDASYYLCWPWFSLLFVSLARSWLGPFLITMIDDTFFGMGYS